MCLAIFPCEKLLYCLSSHFVKRLGEGRRKQRPWRNGGRQGCNRVFNLLKWNQERNSARRSRWRSVAQSLLFFILDNSSWKIGYKYSSRSYRLKRFLVHNQRLVVWSGLITCFALIAVIVVAAMLIATLNQFDSTLLKIDSNWNSNTFLFLVQKARKA